MRWDNGQHFDRTAHTWKDPELFAHVAGAWEGRSGTAATDLVYVPAGETPAAQTIALQANGLEFTGLSHDGAELTEGTDYTVGADGLTLSADLLTRLVGDGGLGERDVLEARFSSGVPWRLHVISAQAPVAQDASGTTAGLNVPVAFNGDQLATMEAVCADGTPAGPADWTAFKEFAVAFEPDYEAGTIALTEAFFAAVNDNSTVKLTFHFWSGKTLEYTVERSGSGVTGSAA